MNRPVSSQIDSDNPWPGLASFTEENSGFFFGRQKETTELVRLIRRNVLTVLFGQSGLGKSSLLQAGAFPALREADYFPLYVRLDHDPAAPALADQVKAALGAAFAAGGIDATAPGANESLWEYFHRKDVDHWSAKNRLLTPVLAFDQFEEIFTLGNADEARRARARVFLTELADLVQHRVPPALRERFETGELKNEHFHFDKASCHIVLSLREDFLPNLEGLKQEMRSVMRGRMRVQRLNGLQALEIVQRPAPHLLAEGVAERIVEFVAGARGGSAERLTEFEVEPALLSVICRELNERRKAAGQTQITADLVTGNRREILTDFYERSVADLPPDMRTFVEDHLLTKSGFRDNLALETALEFPGVTKALIDTLVSRRLLRLEDRLGVQRVELTHDVLAEVIRGSRDSRQQRLAIEKERQREGQTRRRMWLARTIAAGLLVVCAGVSWIAWRAVRAEREQARLRANESALRQREARLRSEAEAQELVARRNAYAADMRGVQRALSIDNLGQARELLFRHRPKWGQLDLRGWEWRYLWQFCQSDAEAVLKEGDGASVLSLAVSSDGEWLAAGGRGEAATLINLRTREERTLPGPARNGVVAFSPTAPLLAFASIVPTPRPTGSNERLARGHIEVWNSKTWQKLWDVPLLDSAAFELLFSADGERLATRTAPSGNHLITTYEVATGAKLTEGLVPGSANSGLYSRWAMTGDFGLTASVVGSSTLVVTELKTGKERWRVDTPDRLVASVALSPDGKVLATGGSYTDAAIRLWDVSSGRALGVLEGHRSLIAQLSFLPDGRRLLSCSGDQTLRLWDLEQRTAISAFRGHKTEAWRIALVPGKAEAISGTKDGAINLWDLSSEHAKVGGGSIAKSGGAWNFIPGSEDIVTVDDAGQVERRAGRQFEQRKSIFTVGPITWAVFAPGQPLLAVSTVGEKVQVWDWQRQVLVRELPGLNGIRRIYPEAFSDDGTRLMGASSFPGRCVEWDLQTGSEVRTAGAGSSVWAAYSSREHRFITVSMLANGMQLDDGNTGSRPHLLPRREPRAPGFSSDGKTLAIPSTVGYVVLLDAASYREVGLLSGYMHGVHTAAFSPDGWRLATGGTAIEALTLWDWTSRERLLVLPASEDQLLSIRFSTDGNLIMAQAGAGQTTGTLHFWRAPSWAEIEAAERKDTGKASP